MLAAYQESEIPLRNVEQRRRYMSYITHSQASITVMEMINRGLSPVTQQLGSFTAVVEQQAKMQAQRALETLRWPLRVLELLIYNTEQVSTILLVNASLVTLLSRSL